MSFTITKVVPSTPIKHIEQDLVLYDANEFIIIFGS